MIFRNRQDAGERLAQLLSKLHLDSRQSVLVGIPRGGVVVANEIAKKLHIPLEIIVIKKLGALYNPELAIGATASFGKPVLDAWLIRDLGISKEYVKGELLNKKKEARKREQFLGVTVSPDKYYGRYVIVVDDGVATGQTARAAAKIIKKFKPKGLSLAVGCVAKSTVEVLQQDYDEIICPNVTDDFMAVGQYYRDFRPVEDEEVKAILTKS